LYAIAGAGGRAPAHSLLLTGVVFNAFASSLIVFATSAADLARVAGVFLWLIGSIRLVEPLLLAAVAVLFAIGLAIALYFAFALNLVAQGDETAAHLGVDVPRVRRWVFAGTALMIGASVAVSGLIGFVGLIVPHLLRLAFGSDHRLLVPASALGARSSGRGRRSRRGARAHGAAGRRADGAGRRSSSWSAAARARAAPA
jgi:iron complex transport system permease protein